VEKDVPHIVAATGGDPAENAGVAFDPYWLQTQFEVLQSKAILYRVITNLNLNKKWEKRLPIRYRVLKNQLEVRQWRSTSLIEIRFSSADRHEAAAVANEIARVYVETKLAAHRERANLEREAREKERLKSGTVQEAVDRGIPKSSGAEIFERAEPPERAYYPNPAHSILLTGAGLLGIVGGFFLRKAR
jgi:uncharacterized protein involved in exopolysaccharide biosynthesis